MSPRGRRVTASQIGQYAFCAYAWWLSVIEKHQPADMGAIDAGTGLHERHGWQVSLARGFSRLALIALGCAFLLLLIWAATAVLS
jgi:hypothetical protein